MNAITDTSLIVKPSTQGEFKPTDTRGQHQSFERVLGHHQTSLSRPKAFLLAQTPLNDQNLKTRVDEILESRVADDPGEMTTGQFIANFVDLALDLYIQQGGDPQQIDPDAFHEVIENVVSTIESHNGFSDINIGRRHGEEVRTQTIKRLRKGVDAVRYADDYQTVLDKTAAALLAEVPKWESQVQRGENLMVVIDLDDTAVIGNSYYFLHHLDSARVDAVGQVAAAREALQNFAEHGITGTQVIPATKTLIDKIEAAAKRLDSVPNSGVLAYTFMAGRPPEYRAKTEQVLTELGLLGDYAYDVYYGDSIGEAAEGAGTPAKKSQGRADLENRGFTIIKVIDNDKGNLTGHPEIDTLMPNIGRQASVFTAQGLRNLNTLNFDAENIQHHEALYNQDSHGLAVVMGRPFEGAGMRQIEAWGQQLNEISNGKIQLNLGNLHARLGTIIQSSDTPLAEADLQTVGLDNIKEGLSRIEPFKIEFKRISFGNERENGNIVLEGEVSAGAKLNEVKRLMSENGAVSIRLASSRPGEATKVFIVLKQFNSEEINSLTDAEAGAVRNWVESHASLKGVGSVSVDIGQLQMIHYSQQQLLDVVEPPEKITLADTQERPAQMAGEFVLQPNALSTNELMGANLRGIQMSPGQDWSGATLIQADLSNSRLPQIDLQSANLTWANLSGADLSGAILSDANLFQANASAGNFVDIRARRVDARGANLSGANLQRADLQEANLHSANLSGSRLMQASLSHTRFDMANLIGADLSAANLHKANLAGADLTDANLSNAMLSDADLRGANLKGVNLSDAVLVNARLENADLTGANLQGATLRGADLGGNARLLLNAENAEPLSHVTSLYEVLSAPEFGGLLSVLQSPTFEMENLDVFIERLNDPDLSGQILKALPVNTVSISRFLAVAERLGVDTQALLWNGLEQHASLMGVSSVLPIPALVSQVQHLRPEQRDYFSKAALPLFTKLYSENAGVRDIYIQLQALLSSVANDQSLAGQSRELTKESFPVHSRFQDEGSLRAFENAEQLGTFQSMGIRSDNEHVHDGIATGIALESRLLTEYRLGKANIDPANYGSKVVDVKELGEYQGIQIYKVGLNHVLGNTLRAELDSGAQFSAEDVQRIREYLREADRSLLNAGLRNNETEFHTGNILISRGSDGRVSEVRLIDLDLEVIDPAEGDYHHIDTLLHLEEISLHYLRASAWSTLPADLPENLTDNIGALSEYVESYVEHEGDVSHIATQLNKVSQFLALIPDQYRELRAPYQSIVGQVLQAGRLDISQLNLNAQTIEMLKPGNGTDSTSVQASSPAPNDVNLNSDPNINISNLSGENPQSHFRFSDDKDISGGRFGTTPFGSLGPSGLNPNGIVGDNGSQAGHQPPNNNGGTITAVAGDAPEPNKPFQVINGEVVISGIRLPELDLGEGGLQSGDTLFGVPAGLPGLPEYTSTSRNETSPTTEQNIPASDTSAQSSDQTSQQQGGVTIGGDLGNDKGKTAAELGLDPSGKLARPEKAKAPDPIPGYGEGVNTQDLNQQNTRDWGDGPVTPDQAKLTPEGFPQKDKTLEDILNPEGPSGARFEFPPGNEEIPAAEYQAVIKTLPALQHISMAEYSQLSSADQKNIISRVVEYQSLPADIKANTSLLQYADSGQTSASQRRQMLGVQQRQTVHTAQQMLSGAQSGLSDSTLQLINTRIEALQQNTAALNQQTQTLTQSNTNRKSALAAPTTADPVTAAFIKPDIKPDQTPPASSSTATPQDSSQSAPIPRFMVIRTANGPQLMENLANGKTQMLPYPIPADTPVTRQSSDGAWRNVPDAYAIGAKNLLDILLLQSTVKMLNSGNAVQAPGAQNAAPQPPNLIPQPVF